MLHLDTHFESKSHVVWDWNGTLLDDVDFCVEIIGAILTRHGKKAISREQYRQAFRFPIIEYYRHLGFDFNQVSFEQLSKEFIQHYHDEVIGRCTLYQGADDLLSAIRQSGRGLSILSAAREQELKELTAHHGVDKHFDNICGLGDHYAVSKIDRGHELIKHLGIPPSEIIMVGDTDHDIEVAEALGIDLLLLADGHQDYQRLRPLHHLTLETRY